MEGKKLSLKNMLEKVPDVLLFVPFDEIFCVIDI